MSATVPSLYASFAIYCSGVTLVTVRDDLRDLFFIAASVLTASVNPFTIAVSIGENRPRSLPSPMAPPRTVCAVVTRRVSRVHLIGDRRNGVHRRR